MKCAWAVLILSSSITLATLAQTSPAGKCRLDGQVVNSITGLPVRKATVTLVEVSAFDPAAQSRPPAGDKDSKEKPVAITDAEGRFAFAGLGAGNYGLSAERTGFRGESYGIPWTAGSGEPVKLAAGDSKSAVAIKLMPLGVIVGRVVDEDGDPIRQVSVSAQIYVATSDGHKLQPRGNAYTNDLGEYRIFDLEPRKYYLKAEPLGKQHFGSKARARSEEWFLASYYPGTPDESGAQPIELPPGRQLQGVDFTLHKGHSTIIRGRVVVPEGASNVSVFLAQRQEGGSSSTMFDANADGSFQMLGLEPGDYILGARCTVDGRPFDTYIPLIVGSSDIADLELRPMRPLSVTGSLQIEGKTDSKISKIVVTLDAKMGFSDGSGNVREDGTFSVRDVPRDIYAVRLHNTPGMFVKSILLGNTDISESGLDLTAAAGDVELSILVSANVATIEGQAVNENGEPATYALVAFIAEKAALSSNAGRDRVPSSAENTGADGHFVFKDLAPGSYRVYAWQRTIADPGRADPGFFSANESQSASITVAEGEQKTVQVKLIKRQQDEQ